MIEKTLINSISGYINIAHKAGYLVVGGDNIIRVNKKLYLLIYCENVGKNTCKIIDVLKSKIPSLETIIVNSDDMFEFIKIKNCKIIGIKNKGISEQIINIIRG